MHLVGFVIRIQHDARSPERQIETTVILRSFVVIYYLRLFLQSVDTFQFGLLSDIPHEDVRTVA